MLRQYLAGSNDEHLLTYTRNPSVIKMLGRFCSSVYPLDLESDLESIAERSPYSSRRSERYYHINRYAHGGLFQGPDPAERTVDGVHPLFERFEPLRNKRNALIVVGKIEGHVDD